MSLLKVKEYLKKYNKENDIIELNVTIETVETAAKALRLTNNEIAKSLAFNINGEYILVVCAGDYRIDNRKFKEYFKEKPRMIERDKVGEIIGHDAGGVCPFGINPGIKVYLDESLKQFKYIYPACGSSNSAIKLTNEELLEISNATSYIDVCKEKDNER